MWWVLFHVNVDKKQVRITVGHSIKGLSAIVYNPWLVVIGRNRNTRVVPGNNNIITIDNFQSFDRCQC